MSVAERLAAVKARIAAAEARAGRAPGSVRLLAVSKTQPLAAVLEAAAAGQRCFGENYVQELVEKADGARGQGVGLDWHFIGHLQSNKARQVVGRADLVHSVDRESLAAELSRRSLGLGGVTPVLLEVNLGGEASKSGVAPEDAPALARVVGALPGLSLRGLMAIPPPVEDPEASRPAFRRLAALAREIDALGVPGVEMRELSMGMSHDFEVAIEEGATLVRVGTAIFGPRAPKQG